MRIGIFSDTHANLEALTQVLREFDRERVDKLGEETIELRQHLREFPSPGPHPEGHGVAGSGRQNIPDDLRLRLEEEVGGR